MSQRARSQRNLRVAIIGAGASGLCMAIRLKQSGFDDFVVLEQADDLGGTWYHNTYPGCACDIPSHLYSFSFETKRDWARPYASQEQIRGYLEHCAEKYEVRQHCRFGATVKSARWDEERSRWSLELDEAAETIEADVVVSALGMFNELTYPEVEGIESFTGTRFHSARWNWEHDLTGKTVGVIGSAASATQFVPEIIKQADQVHLFQRTANWVMPKQDDPFPEEVLQHFQADLSVVPAIREEIFHQVDGGMTFSDPIAVAELEASVLESMQVIEDPTVRERLRPQHPFGCKRPLLSNDYYPAFNRPNLELVTDSIKRITADGVETVDGALREVDTLIFATGFSATKYLATIDVRGRKGQSIDEAWSDGAVAYLGITTAGFPNLFMLYGPNTNNGSLLTMIEAQVEYSLQQIQRLANEDLAWLDVRPETMARYNDEVQRAIDGVSAWQAGCNGYYRTPSGRIVTQWPYSMSEFQARTAKPDDDAFETAPLP
jgi:cation diffusion facilitator CzcD-associated flavoprotein CzcO